MGRWTFRLLDLPAEVRLRIYEHIFGLQNPDRRLFTALSLGSSRYISLLSLREIPNANILRLSRQVHEEASKVLFAKVDTLVEMDISQSRRQGGPVLGSIEDIHFWPYLQNLHFDINLRDPAKQQVGAMRPMKTFLKAIDHGKHLRRLRVVLTTDNSTPLSPSLSETTELLSFLRVNGDVKVFLHIPTPWQGWRGPQVELDMQRGRALCRESEDRIRDQGNRDNVSAFGDVLKRPH